jgi:hypothetical protein
MRRSSLITTVALGAAVVASGAEARLDVYVDKSTQRLSVSQNGALLYVWPISTGQDRFSTPSGVYLPERLERSWFSKAYYNSPMPHAIFFHNGYAIHGSYDTSKLGGPASHGCVRLHPRDAALLYALVEREGPGNTVIFVGGNSNRPSPRYHNFDDPARSAWRRRDNIVAGGSPPRPMAPPGDRADRYGDGAGAYPPPGSRESPYYLDRYVDGNPHPSRLYGTPYYDTDRHIGEGRGVPRVAPNYDVDPYAEARGAPHGPGITPDYGVGPYSDGRAAPRDPNVPLYYDPDRHGDGRGAYPRGPSAPPYYSTDHRADGPVRPRGDESAMRGNYPAARPDGEAPFERIPRINARPATSSAKARPGRLSDDPFNRSETAVAPSLPPAPSPVAASLPPTAPPARMDPPPEQQPSNMGYKVLPKSYWAGASWRWRIKRDDDTPRDSQ